jgi:uncharacterized protein YciI/GNAT superfamily N-acetyltransferase
MYFVVVAWDGPDDDAPDRRARARAAHLELIDPLVQRGDVVIGGAVLNEAAEMIGSIVICNFASRQELDDWLRNDPYVTQHVWRDIEIHSFRPAVGKWIFPTGTADAVLAGSKHGRVVVRQPGPGDYGWVVSRHGALYWQDYGWDETFEALVARIVGEYAARNDPTREHAWIAEVGGERAGCVFCVRKDEETAQLRLLLVEQWARGHGVGTRLVDECISFARSADYRRIMLWTNDVLTAARRIYERAGFSLLEEEPHRSFGHNLVGQNWGMDL